jgi:acyl-coenzyme A synthetase/AMP-(fatty) acid ligase
MTSYPLIGSAAPKAVFAHSGGPVTIGRFLSEVADLARQLPARKYVINRCRDRYRFTVGFAAALCREQVTLLPPNETPALIEQLALDYPDLYSLGDVALAPDTAPAMRYPETLADAAPPAAIPSFAAGQLAAVLFTSGSTGKPQPHGRSWGTLVRSTEAAGRAFGTALERGLTLLGTVPHQHSYGLESLVMLALQHGLALHGDRPFFPADIRARLETIAGPRMLVTTPIHLRALLADGAAPRIDLLLSATAPLSPQIATAAEARFKAPVFEIYGCSEAGQIALRRTALSEEWRCLDGITLRQDAAEATWVAGAPIEVETRLNDVIELRAADRFLLHGRTADLVNIAGKRTSLAHLNYHLNAIAGVEDGAFVVPEEVEGEVKRLVAFVVAPGLIAEAVRTALRQRIDAAFLPRPLHLVAALPRNELGKLTQEAVGRLLAAAGGEPA